MKATGIITEYNPFHYGHLYHLKKAREISEANTIVCVMNGNFMQRGTPALTDKWSRTRMALLNGVDLIVELPLIYGIRSAEFFAEGAVKTLAATGIINSIVFGSESGEIESLKELARIFVDEPDYFQQRLKHYLDSGYSFPGAREKAVRDFLKNSSSCENIVKALAAPNNILGIEYIKAITKLNSNIKPLTIKRQGADYHSQDTENVIASATAIRKLLTNEIKIQKLVPDSTWGIIREDLHKNKIPVRKDILGTLILARLRQIPLSEIKKYHGMGNGLESRIKEAAYKTGDLKQLINEIKTRTFTWTRIQRSLLQIIFGLTEENLEFLSQGPYYLRILGFNKKGENLLSAIKKNSQIPLITQPADYLHDINTESSDPLIRQLSFDLLSSDLYTLLYSNPDERQGNLDFYKTVEIV